MRYYLNNKSTKLSESSISIFIGWVIHMCLFARLLFYFTGHQYAFSSLQLDSGFILSDSFNFYTAGMMLAINTFISEVFGILIILVLVSYIKRFDKNQGKKKEMIILTITLFKLSTVFCSCLSAFILRRHLMVWAVFAPKVIFEVSFWLVSSLILLFT
jgi:phosphatidylinositol glycan class O